MDKQTEAQSQSQKQQINRRMVKYDLALRFDAVVGKVNKETKATVRRYQIKLSAVFSNSMSEQIISY